MMESSAIKTGQFPSQLALRQMNQLTHYVATGLVQRILGLELHGAGHVQPRGRMGQVSFSSE